ncbi:SGF29 tudor-like domain-containing protein [Lipomyces arxii]|uniref:SGF29 tudor-like domain-containing protein n=1 Tax=Lipomyces arxii TaxID=56418 RepID=UPI0034CE48F8
MSSRIRSRPSSVAMSSQSGVDSSGEVEVWNKICTELRKLPKVAAMGEAARAATEKIGSGVALEGDDEDMAIDEGEIVKTEDAEDPRALLAKMEQLKDLYQKQIEYAQTEKKIIDQANEDLSILTALRQATESAVTDSKRKKRKTEEPAVLETPKMLKKARSGSAVPSDGPVIGAQVAFRLKKQKGAEAEWIQCEITKITGEGNKMRFEIQDPEPDENNNPGQMYKAGLKDIILIPESSIDLPVHPSGTKVLARYPETTTFYKAEVMGTKRDGTCRLKFEGEEEVGKETEVERRLVIEMPKG